MNSNKLTVFLTLGAGIGFALGAILGIFIGNITLGVLIALPIFTSLALLSSKHFKEEE
ncbi:MAG: hypothetical protein ACWA5P_03450 [bacterium]